MRTPPRHPRVRFGAYAAGLALVCLAAGCTADADDDQVTPPITAVPTTTKPPTDENGDFFTWQQRRALSGEAQAVATTRRAWDYYDELGLRYGGYKDPAWAKVAPPEFAERLGKPQGADIILRGDVRYLLYSVQIAGGGSATTVTCRDNSNVERRYFDQDAREPSREPDVIVMADRYRRAASSPTGWISADPAATDVTREQCARALAQQPAVSITGTAGLPGS